MIDEKNIFDKGMLIAIHSGSFQGRKKLSQDQLKDLPTEIVRGVFDMFEKDFKDSLKKIKSMATRARNKVKDMSIPFPIDSVYFLPSMKIKTAIEELDTVWNEREKLIDDTLLGYDKAIQAFRVKYPEFYEKAKNSYPSKGRIRQRFYFKYQFIKVAPPDKNSLISSEQYKEEYSKFKDSISEMKGEVLAIIYSSLLESTTRLKEQCTGGKPNQRTLNTLNDFLKQVDEVYSDFIDREDMKNTIDKIKKNVLGVTADDLRDSKGFKKKFANEIGVIAKEIKALPDIPLKRSIMF